MTLLYNGNFALKVFNISDIHELIIILQIIQDDSGIQVFSESGKLLSRVWTRQFGQLYGLAEDEERLLWFIIFDRKAKEAILKCFNPEKEEFLEDLSLNEKVGDRHRESMCRFLTFSKGKLYISDFGLATFKLSWSDFLQDRRVCGSSSLLSDISRCNRKPSYRRTS